MRIVVRVSEPSIGGVRGGWAKLRDVVAVEERNGDAADVSLLRFCGVYGVGSFHEGFVCVDDAVDRLLEL